MQLGLVGKRYEDTKLYANSNILGETNNLQKIETTLGGIYNFKQTKNDNYELTFVERGIKKAYIIEETSKSSRSSYTIDISASHFDDKTISYLNQMDWVHFSYIDDLENIESLSDLAIPYSIDFCMNKSRTSYVKYMESASIIFDSRERKELYKDINLKTPLILHDEYGSEIIINGIKEYERLYMPLLGLNVNGAGDIYAKYFIQSYFFEGFDIKRSSRLANEQTTEFLKNRRLNEKI